ACGGGRRLPLATAWRAVQRSRAWLEFRSPFPNRPSRRIERRPKVIAGSRQSSDIPRTPRLSTSGLGSELLAVDLADGGVGDVADVDLAGVLVAADALLGEGDELLGRDLLARMQRDERDDLLSVRLVRPPHHAGERHRG